MQRALSIKQLKNFNARTSAFMANHRGYLREYVLGKIDLKNESRMEREKRLGLDLPFDLGFLRVEAAKALGMPCRYCGVPLTVSTLSLDHIIPHTRTEECIATLRANVPNFDGDMVGGRSLLAFAWENLEFICRRCNKRKGELTRVEYEMLVSLVTSMPTVASKYIFTKLSSAPLQFHSVKAKGESANASR